MNRRYVIDLSSISSGVERRVLIFSMQMYRVTIRATQDTVPKVMLKMMEERLSRGISTEFS